jgi:hypothetical protein
MKMSFGVDETLALYLLDNGWTSAPHFLIYLISKAKALCNSALRHRRLRLIGRCVRP